MFTEKQKSAPLSFFVGIKRKAAGQPAVVYSSEGVSHASEHSLQFGIQRTCHHKYFWLFAF